MSAPMPPRSPAPVRDPELDRATHAARLAIDLLEAARELGDAALIAAAEVAAYAAGVALDGSLAAHEP